MRIEIVQGNIIAQDTDAIVNAANSTLLGGGGVDGAIHRAAGAELVAFCRSLGGCDTGDAKMSPGFGLTAQYVIHTVGPIYRGHAEDPKLLASCYQRSLNLAEEHGLQSIAFPAISTGVFGYPLIDATRIAIDTVRAHEAGSLQLVRFVCFDASTREVYERLS